MICLPGGWMLVRCCSGYMINGTRPGRENDDEIIYFNAIGMGIEDLCVVAHAYRLALEKDEGVAVNYWAE